MRVAEMNNRVTASNGGVEHPVTLRFLNTAVYIRGKEEGASGADAGGQKDYVA
jgi:hypothetical protein